MQYYHYYWCNKCRGTNFSAIKVHADLKEILAALSLSKEHAEALKALSEIELNESLKDKEDKLSKIQTESAQIETRLHLVEEKYFDKKIDDATYRKWHDIYTSDINKHKISISNLSRDEKQVYKLYDDNIEYLTDLNYLYKKSEIEEKYGFLKSIFPGCLIALKTGYRTPFINNLFSANIPSLKGLVEVEIERGLPFLEKSPVGVANGARTHDPRYHKPIF